MVSWSYTTRVPLLDATYTLLSQNLTDLTELLHPLIYWVVVDM